MINIKMPAVKQDFYPLSGGLDLLTPAIEISPGKCFDAQNYEPQIGGGYARIYGYERFDGRASPTAAAYYLAVIVQTGTIAVGDTVTGSTSAATGKVLGLFGTSLVLGRVTGTFTALESFTIAAVGVGSFAGAINYNGAPAPSDHADYKLLAANDWRTLVGQVPGSGRIRGIFVYNDIVYAFRDNAGATAGDMYKSTAAGWVKITFGTEIQFNTALAAGASVAVGDAINGATSGATAVVVKVLLRTGAFDGTGLGTIILSTVVGVFINGEVIRKGATASFTATTAATAIARAVGGKVESMVANFTGSTATTKVYGADGVNLAFEFDGTNYIPIRTAMTVDTPLHMMVHRNYLFLSFLGSVQLSGIGNPYAWTTVLGASEITTGDAVTGFLPQGGTSSGSSLAIFTTGKTFVLYGSSAANFQLVASAFDLGYSGYTMQQVGNTAFGLTARGVQSLITTLTYGDFEYASITHQIQTLITAKRGLECSSTTSRTKNQFRLYFTDGTGLVIGLQSDKITGVMPLSYGRPVYCTATATLTTGAEVTYFGSDDGYVFQDSTGTSFDGAVIEAWCRLAFNHGKSPRIRKRYRRAVIEASVTSYCRLSVSYDLGYGSPNVSPSTVLPVTMIGAGGYWDQLTWDQFVWDAQVINDATLALTGTEKNISLLFYSSRAQDDPHVLQGITIMYSLGRIER